MQIQSTYYTNNINNTRYLLLQQQEAITSLRTTTRPPSLLLLARPLLLPPSYCLSPASNYSLLNTAHKDNNHHKNTTKATGETNIFNIINHANSEALLLICQLQALPLCQFFADILHTARLPSALAILIPCLS